MQRSTTPSYLKICLLMVSLFLISCGQKDSEATAQSESQPVPIVFKDVDVAEFDKLRQNKGVIVIDVRTPEETVDGMVPNAVEIDINGEIFEAAISELDRSKQYLVYCRSGIRSVRASQHMIDNGFTDVTNLLGGYNAWSEAHQKE